jgi:hypothetical protein
MPSSRAYGSNPASAMSLPAAVPAMPSVPLIVSAGAVTSTVTPDLDVASVYAPAAMTGNLTVAAPVNPSGRLTFLLTQDRTGRRTVSWNKAFKHNWSDAGNLATRRSSISFIYDGTFWVQDGAQLPWF